MTEEGWRAECQHCPTTVDPAYGNTVKVHVEFPLTCQADAELWGIVHGEENPGHHVHMTRFVRWEWEAEHIDPEIWRKLCGD